MKEIPLSRGYVAIVDNEDYDRFSGVKWFSKIERRKDGSVRNVYAVRRKMVSGKSFTQYLHRLIVGVDDPEVIVDHRNQNGLDNKRANLRKCNKSQNAANGSAHIYNTSGVRGVSWCSERKKWTVHIRVNGKNRSLGRYGTKEEAAAVYRAAAKEAFGEFAPS